MSHSLSPKTSRDIRGSLRLSSDSEDGDVEEGQVVSIESSDEDEVIEIVSMDESDSEVQSCHSDDDDQFVTRDETQIYQQKNVLCNFGKRCLLYRLVTLLS